MKETIHFYYSNDLHSNFEQWPKVVTYFQKKRQECAKKEQSCWLFDIGDHMDRVHPITEATLGKANVELLNQADYDLVTIGNNEGVTLPEDKFFHLYDDATFEVVCSNLEYTQAKGPAWLKTSSIIESEHGIKIGVIGLTARFNPYYNLLGWNVTPIYETIDHELKELQGKTDIIILLSHLGINEDERIAREFPEIDIIMGGHTHHLLKTGKMVHHTLLSAAGKFCNYVGEIIITFDHKLGMIVNKEAYATDITHLPGDDDTVQSIQRMERYAKNVLQDEIIYSEKPIEIDWFKPVPIMEALTEKVRQKTNADCGMLNAGLLVRGFNKGSITYQDVHKACPHPINPCVVTLTGDELTEVVRVSVSPAFMGIELKGFGFRGKVIGRMVFANLEVIMGEHSDGQSFVKDIYFNQKPIEGDAIYKVATADMFTFGRLLPQVARSPHKKLFLPEFIRGILVDALQDYHA